MHAASRGCSPACLVHQALKDVEHAMTENMWQKIELFVEAALGSLWHPGSCPLASCHGMPQATLGMVPASKL